MRPIRVAPFVLRLVELMYYAQKLLLIVVMLNRQINVTLLSRNIKLLWTSFDLLTDTLTPSVTDWLLIMYGILPRQLFFVAAVVCTVGHGIFYMANVDNFLLVN